MTKQLPFGKILIDRTELDELCWYVKKFGEDLENYRLSESTNYRVLISACLREELRRIRKIDESTYGKLVTIHREDLTRCHKP